MSGKLLRAVMLVAAHCLTAAAQTPSNVEDLRDWRTLGLPMAAEWNTDGFTWQYHVKQVRDGKRFLPSIKVPYVAAQANSATQVGKITALPESEWKFLRDNSVPICLRTQNISGAFVLPAYRLPITSASIPNSPLVWSMKGGKLGDEKLVDVFGPPSNWANEGALWGKSLLMKTLQSKLKTPAYVIFLENNEGPYDSVARYVKSDNSLRTSLGFPTRTWLPTSTIRNLSLRMRDRVAVLQKSNPPVSPDEFLPEYWTLRRQHYASFFQAFEKQLTTSWKGKTRTTGYGAMSDAWQARPAMYVESLGYAPQLTYFDAGSEPIYCTSTNLGDFTSPEHLNVLNLIPAWEVARSRNPDAYRELSLYISNGAILNGAERGAHEVMTPERYEGYVHWLLWSIHDPGVPVILRHWCSSSEKPNDLLFETSQHSTLDSLNASQLKTATNNTYVQSIVSAVDRVCCTAKLRDFWLRGKPVIVSGAGHPSKQTSTYAKYPCAGEPDNRWRFLECSANTPRAKWEIADGVVDEKIRVWAVATRLEGAALLFAWSPCRLDGDIRITLPDFGDFEVPAPRPWSYWIVKRGVAPVNVAVP